MYDNTRTHVPAGGESTHQSPPGRSGMLRVARWCIAHRRAVVLTWVAVAVLTTLLAGSVGWHYATDFTLPGTDSQRARVTS
jgi:uncharacterized membrane protein YdfJ with MMPL/SSD domain